MILLTATPGSAGGWQASVLLLHVHVTGKKTLFVSQTRVTMNSAVLPEL